jgi:hypothetical protein
VRDFIAIPALLINFLGFAAALCVLASFCMTTIVALRAIALLSNVLFIFYGSLAHIHPVLFLHIVLLPINLIKLRRILGRVNFTIQEGVELQKPKYSSG